MYLFNTKVVKNRQLSPDIFRLKIAAMEDFCHQVAPGRFVMLGNDNKLSDPLLKRPFGICNWGNDWFEVVIKVVGKGSRQLGRLQTGASISVNGPLGEGYPQPDCSTCDNDNEILILVAGGIGIASIASCLLPVESNGYLKKPTVLLFGAATENDLVLLNEIKQSTANLRIETITDDGSSGRQGFVTELLKTELQKSATLTFACGPEPMLKNVQQVLQDYNAKGYLSLENRMACGFGVCLGCVQTIFSNPEKEQIKSAKVCTQGPVFAANEVVF